MVHQDWPESPSHQFLSPSILCSSHSGLSELPCWFGQQETTWWRCHPSSASALPWAKLICSAKQHKEHTLLALQACANPPGNGKWQRLTFWCYCFKGSTKNRFPFFHIPSHGTEVNEVRERSPFLNMICFLVCELFRMPMPAGYRGILVREFPCPKLKKKHKRSRPQCHFCLETLPWTWCFAITIHQWTKNDFLSTRSRNVTQTPEGYSWCQSWYKANQSK